MCTLCQQRQVSLCKKERQKNTYYTVFVAKCITNGTTITHGKVHIILYVLRPKAAPLQVINMYYHLLYIFLYQLLVLGTTHNIIT